MSKSETATRIIFLQRKGALDAARAEYASLKENLDSLEEQEILGNFAFYERRFQAAVSHYETAISASEAYLIAPYQYLVALNHANAGEAVEAFKRFVAAIEIDPTFVDAYVELGVLLMQVKDYPGAVHCFKDALRVDPNDLGNYHNLVQALTLLAKAEPGAHVAELDQAQIAYESAKRRLPYPRDDFRLQVDA